MAEKEVNYATQIRAPRDFLKGLKVFRSFKTYKLQVKHQTLTLKQPLLEV